MLLTYTDPHKSLHTLYPLLENNAEVFVAGGCFKDILSGKRPRDVDVYFKNVDRFNITKIKFENSPTFSLAYENKNCVAFHNNKQSDCIVELIKHQFGSPEEILTTFDFSICRYALFQSNGIYKVMFDEHFDLDLQEKRLRISKLSDEIKADEMFNRVIKYSQYGYTLGTASKEALFYSIRNYNGAITDVSNTGYTQP